MDEFRPQRRTLKKPKISAAGEISTPTVAQLRKLRQARRGVEAVHRVAAPQSGVSTEAKLPDRLIGAPNETASEQARHWLRTNGYDEVVKKIDQVLAIYSQSGVRSRRNWWETLAGGKNGRPRIVKGILFPVLEVAQLRQGVPVTPNAIPRQSEQEQCPGPRKTGRW